MKTIVFAATLAVLTTAAGAQDMATPAVLKSPNNHVCLWTYMIDHTTTVDANTILFHLKNGQVWRNTLQGPCRGLKFHGFTYLTRSDTICSNAVPISVIETHEACSLGNFTATTPGEKSPGVNTP
ncbi:MAG TPA: hypothetical protein VGF97_19215 [Rhizomicrobium sp.]|jgi:hypothetical protein